MLVQVFDAHVIITSGVARPQTTRALAWGVEIKYFVNCSTFLLFDTVQYCSCDVGPGRNPWLATLLIIT
jgi:hypothetical protein